MLTNKFRCANEEASVTLTKKLLTFGWMFGIILSACTACTGSPLKPEAALWGEWAYAGGDGGSMDYVDDLSFQEDGTLTRLGRPQFQAAYVVIAPGRIKLTVGGSSEVLNYSLEEDTLTLYFGDRHNTYTRAPETRPIAQGEPVEAATVIPPTNVVPIDTPFSQPSTEEKSVATESIGQTEGVLGSEETPIIWTLVPIGDTETVLLGFQNVADIIYQQTGLVVEPFVSTNYSNVIDIMSTDPPKAHMSSMPTFPYMIASQRGAAKAELVSLRRGSSAYNGQIFVRADSGITSIADLAGKIFCGVDPLSNSGWIIPSITLAAYGVNPDRDLAGVVFAGSHEAAVAAVYQSECDAGSSYIDARLNIKNDFPDVMNAITIIEVTVDIPNDGVQYHPSVPRELRDKINGVLLSIHETQAGAEAMFRAFEWNELVYRDDSFYDPFRQILDAAGVNLEPFINNFVND